MSFHIERLYPRRLRLSRTFRRYLPKIQRSVGVCPFRGLCRAGFEFFYGSASLGWKGRAVVQPGNGAVLAGFCRFRHDERNMAFSSRGLRRAVEPVRRQVCGLAAVIQARIERGQMTGERLLLNDTGQYLVKMVHFYEPSHAHA